MLDCSGHHALCLGAKAIGDYHAAIEAVKMLLIEDSVCDTPESAAARLQFVSHPFVYMHEVGT